MPVAFNAGESKGIPYLSVDGLGPGVRGAFSTAPPRPGGKGAGAENSSS